MRDQNREGIQIPLLSCKKPSSSSIRQSSQNREGMNTSFQIIDNFELQCKNPVLIGNSFESGPMPTP